MKLIGEQKAHDRLARLKASFKKHIADDYEHAAKSCMTCETPGVCCLDAHFVNVHISPLEAVAINVVLDRLRAKTRERVEKRTQSTIKKCSLTAEGDTFARTYACPLFENGVGCLVHASAKPLPCIHHGCYETALDLPPDELLDQAEMKVQQLNRRAYGSPQSLLPLPLAIIRFR